MNGSSTILSRFAAALLISVFTYTCPLFAQPSLQTLEAQTRAIITKAEKSVVTLVISTTPYEKQNSAEMAKGKLGRYSGGLSSNDPLDLSVIANAVNHQRGNGIVMTANGLILCPFHLIEGATKIYVRTSSGKGSYADIHAADSRSDLAVLRTLDPLPGIVPVTLPTTQMGKPVANRGDFAIAISGGSPDELNSSFGLVTSVDKKISIPVEPLLGQQQLQPLVCHPTLIQVDARSARGVSGGAVFNLKGELIGMTTALAAVAGSDQAPGYAIPMDRLYQPIISELLKGVEVEYGFLGVTWGSDRPGRFGGFGMPRPQNREINPDGGVTIGTVSPGMPAMRAGIRDGDVLMAVNGFPLTTMDDLQFRIGAALAISDTRLTIRRSDNTTETLNVRLAKANNPMPWMASQRPEPVFGFQVDHLSTLMQDLYKNEQGIRKFTMPTLPSGVVVVNIQPGSPAEKAFSEPNRRYIITKVDGTAVSSPTEFHKLAKGAKSLTLTFVAVNSLNSPQEVTLP